MRQIVPARLLTVLLIMVGVFTCAAGLVFAVVHAAGGDVTGPGRVLAGGVVGVVTVSESLLRALPTPMVLRAPVTVTRPVKATVVRITGLGGEGSRDA